MAIVIDTETTGLLRPKLAANELQPQIIEIYLGRFDEKTFKITEEFNTLVKPVTKWGEQILLEDPINELRHICRITNIYDDMLHNKETFEEIAESISEFCDGEELILGQNVMFDFEVLRHNFIRVEKEEFMNYFPIKRCTVEMSYCLKKKRLKLKDLYHLATGIVFEGGHRAKQDAIATLECYQWLLQEGL